MVSSFWTVVPRTSNKKGITFFNKMLLRNLIVTCKETKLDTYFILLTKLNPKWIKDLNVRPRTIKILEENRKKKKSFLGNDFLDNTPKA